MPKKRAPRPEWKREADKRYKPKNVENQRKNYIAVCANLNKADGEEVRRVFAQNDLMPAEVITAAAQLLQGESGEEMRALLKAAAQKWREERHPPKPPKPADDKPKRGRGRPRKQPAQTEQAAALDTANPRAGESLPTPAPGKKEDEEEERKEKEEQAEERPKKDPAPVGVEQMRII